MARRKRQKRPRRPVAESCGCIVVFIVWFGQGTHPRHTNRRKKVWKATDIGVGRFKTSITVQV